jgi:hypothetical protein
LKSVYRRDFTWFFEFSDEVVVTTESLWRLLVDGRIRYTSSDDQQRFGHPKPVDVAVDVKNAIGDSHLSRVEVDDLGDLLLSFEGGAAIEVLITSGGYESYTLRIGHLEFFATGGGKIL